MSAEHVRHSTVGATCVIHIDDGKANAIGHEIIDAMNAVLDTAEADDDVGAIALIGRPGKFSAGFDLSVMRSGTDAAQGLTKRGAELCMRLYGFSRPVVAGCTGHALAAGALLLLSSDVRIGAEGEFQIGLPEVALGMPLPVFATELARDRISRRHFTAAAQLATPYDPAAAVDVGYLDRVTNADDVESAAIDTANELAGRLDRAGFAATRINARRATIDRVMDTLDADMATFTVPS